jgi:CubicO group peptidase (beta-lactamase class C family)
MSGGHILMGSVLRMKLALCLVFLASALPAQEYFPPPDSAGGWRTLKEPAQIRKTGGMDAQKLDYAFEYASRTSQHGGLLVVRHGYLVYEKYYGKGNREATPAMASVGKAYTSIACGIMLREKRALIPDGLDTKVFTEKYLPEAFPLSDPRKAEIRLGHLLTMGSGMHGEGGNPGIVNFEPSVKLDPLPRPAQRLGQDEAALQVPLWCNPGDGYSYSSQSPHVASIVLRHLVGMEMQDTSTGSWPSRWAGGRGATRCTRARRPCRIRPEAPTLPSAPPMPPASATSCCTRAAGASSSLCRPITSPCVASLRPTRSTLPSA